MENGKKNEGLSIEMYRGYFLQGLNLYLKSPLILKDGNVVESAYVFSFNNYLYQWLPDYIAKKHGLLGMLNAIQYARGIENDELLGEYIEDFKKAIESVTERYIIAKDGVNYLKEMGNVFGKNGNVIVIEYKKKDEK